MHVLRTLLGRIGLYEIIAFITGFALMAFELGASRILAPAIGTSMYVWTSVIGVMIAALAVGYAVGGWMADRRDTAHDVIWILLAAALTVLATCMFYQSTLEAIGFIMHDPRLQGVCASIVLFAPTSFLLGACSPYLAKLRIKSIKTTGRSVAGLSAANSVGGIVGTFCTGFVFFTIFGSRETLSLLAGLLIAASWFVIPSFQRRARVIATVVLTATMLLQFAVPAAAGVVAEIDTPSAHYVVQDGFLNGKPVRVLVTGPNGWQSGIYLDESPNLAFDYTRKIADAVDANPQRDHILILGGGAFTLPEYLGNGYPHSRIDVVEIDPHLPDIAKQYFNYRQPQNVQVFSEDARTYLQSTTERYDIVIVDVYNDSSVPFALTTREYTAGLKRVLTSDGVVVANIVGSGSANCIGLLSSLHNSYASTFSRSLFYPLDDPTLQHNQNIITLYSNGSLGWADALPGSAVVKLESGERLTDNHAPVEYMKLRCGN